MLFPSRTFWWLTINLVMTERSFWNDMHHELYTPACPPFWLSIAPAFARCIPTSPQDLRRFLVTSHSLLPGRFVGRWNWWRSQKATRSSLDMCWVTHKSTDGRFRDGARKEADILLGAVPILGFETPKLLDGVLDPENHPLFTSWFKNFRLLRRPTFSDFCNPDQLQYMPHISTRGMHLMSDEVHMPRMEANSDIALFSQQANKAPHPLGKLQVGRYGIVASGHQCWCRYLYQITWGSIRTSKGPWSQYLRMQIMQDSAGWRIGNGSEWKRGHWSLQSQTLYEDPWEVLPVLSKSTRWQINLAMDDHHFW